MATYNSKSGKFLGYLNSKTSEMYKSPDINTEAGTQLSDHMDVSFSLTNTGSVSSGQAIQIVLTNLPIASAKYKSGSDFGFVDGGKNSPGYHQNNDNETQPRTPYYIGIFQGKPTGEVTSTSSGSKVTLRDYPDAQTIASAKVNFQTIIVATNFYGSGQNVVMGVFNWGFQAGKSVMLPNNGQTHQTNKIDYTNLNSQSLDILKTDYETYKLHQ